MTYESHRYSIEDALARNNDVYEVEFESWGTRLNDPGVVFPEVNLQFPPPGSRPIPSSVAAIAIGPRSLVDRCWVSWDRQKNLNVPSVADGPTDPNDAISLPRIVTCDAPLLFPQATTKGPTLELRTQSWWDAMQFGTAYVFPWGPKPGFNSAAQGAGNSRHLGDFGTTTGYYQGQKFISLTGEEVIFAPEEPFLQLLLYTKLPAFSPPTKRASMLRTGFWDVGDPFMRIYPIFGRKHVAASFISHNFTGIPASTADFTLGLIRNVNETPKLFEVKGAEALAVPANTGVNLQINNPCADYLVVRVNAAPADKPASGAFTIVAED